MAQLLSTSVTGNLSVTQNISAGDISAGNISASNVVTYNIISSPGTSANVYVEPDGTGNLVITSTTPVVVQNSIFVTGNTSTGNLLIGSNGYIYINVSTKSPDEFAANQVILFAKNVANQVMLSYDTPKVNNFRYSPEFYMPTHPGFKQISLLRPPIGAPTTNSTIQTNVIGLSINVYSNSAQTTVGSNVSGSLFKSVQRRITIGANNSATVGNACMIANVNTVWAGGTTGNLAGNGGGYLFISRFCYETLGANVRSFVGMTNSQASGMIAGAGDYDPMLNTTFSIIGVGANAATGNLWYLVGPHGSARTVVDSTITINITDMYELVVSAQPGNGSVGLKLKNLSNGAESQTVQTTNLPAQNTFMQPVVLLKSNTAAASNISVVQWYLEAD